MSSAWQTIPCAPPFDALLRTQEWELFCHRGIWKLADRKSGAVVAQFKAASQEEAIVKADTAAAGEDGTMMVLCGRLLALWEARLKVEKNETRVGVLSLCVHELQEAMDKCKERESASQS